MNVFFFPFRVSGLKIIHSTLHNVSEAERVTQSSDCREAAALAGRKQRQSEHGQGLVKPVGDEELPAVLAGQQHDRHTVPSEVCRPPGR